VGFSQGPSIPGTFSPRWNFSSAYFPPADQVVVFGGAPVDNSTVWRDDTWMFTAGAWVQGPAAPSGLTPRGGAAMAYDPDIGKIVLFGGEARAADGTGVWPPYSNETWLWDGVSWSPGPAAPPGLAGRTGAQMVYDDSLHELVLFGGSGLAPYTDTWLFDGTQWVQGPQAPPEMLPREFFGMTYDPEADRVIVGGGDGGTDVWLFDGTSWQPGPAFPDTMKNPARERTRMAYDPQIGATLLFGGLGPGASAFQMYYLRASEPDAAWTVVPESPPVPGPEAPPPPRLDGGIVWLPTTGAMFMFGGIKSGYEGRVWMSDTWFFRDVAPAVTGVRIHPQSPTVDQGLDATLAPKLGGYHTTTPAIRWAINGVPLTGETGRHLDPQYQVGDVIQAQVQLTDSLGLTGPWVGSNTAVVVGSKGDRSATAPAALVAHSQTHQPAARPPSGTSGARSNATERVVAPGAPVRQDDTCDSPTPGQVIACQGQFWQDGQPILLHGVETIGLKGDDPMTDEDWAKVASWHMNEARITVTWARFESTPPTDNGNGTWTHHYTTGLVPLLRDQIAMAQAHGISVVLHTDCLCAAGWPKWLTGAAYNSHHTDYDLSDPTSLMQFKTDYWSDDLMKQFTMDWATNLASWVSQTPGVIGYEPLNEPDQGSFRNSHSTTQMILDWQLQLAHAVRAVDPNRVIFFTTRGADGDGIIQADLSGWTALGNVAYDLHDFFGARWGSGYNLYVDPEGPTYGEAEAPLFNFTLRGTMPPYLGTTLVQMRFIETSLATLQPAGIPLYIGEFADRLDDPNILTLFGTMTQAFNLEGASWNALAYDGYYRLIGLDGSLKPWVPILCNAAAYPNVVTDCPSR
jgi:hypothetical protein